MVTPVASPSMPSVRFTAFTVPTMTKAANTMYTTQGRAMLTFRKGIYKLGVEIAPAAQQHREDDGRRQLKQELLGGGQALIGVVAQLLEVIDKADDPEDQRKQEHIHMVPVPHADLLPLRLL